MSATFVLRSSRLSAEAFTSTSRSLPSVSRLGQTRGYAQKKKVAVKQHSSGFKGNKGKDPKEKGFKKEKKHGTFLTLPANQVTNTLFKPDNRVVLDLPTYSTEALTSAAVGKAMAFPMSENEAIRAYGVPKNLVVEFRVLSKPCSVVRDVTVTAIDTLDEASSKSSRDTRLVMTGPSGCGKSFLLLQAVEYAAHNKWIVMYIPRAIKMVDSSTAYTYDSRTRTYLQPNFSYEILRRFFSVNQSALQHMKSRGELVTELQSLPEGTPLLNFVQAGLSYKEDAPAVLSALMDELSRQTTHPVLLAVDDIQALYNYTAYRDPHYRALMPQHLSIPRIVLEYASGKRAFARGAVFGAESTSNTAFQMPLELSEALGIPPLRPAGPYVARSKELAEYAQGLRNFPVPAQLSVDEAASLFELWMKDNALHSGEVRGTDGELQSRPNDELFMTKYCEASGNPRAFVWKGLLSTMSSY